MSKKQYRFVVALLILNFVATSVAFVGNQSHTAVLMERVKKLYLVLKVQALDEDTK